VALGDVDGDGDLDLVCGNYLERSTLYVNEGGTFSTPPAWSSGPVDWTTTVALGDVDGDGDLDLVCGNSARRSTLYVNQEGTLARTPAWASGPADDTRAVALGDVDGDGDLDLVCGNVAQSSTLYRTLKNPAFKGDPLSPRGHLPNNAAHLRWVSVGATGSTNRRTIDVTAIDVESDPVWIVPAYQYEGTPDWTVLALGGRPRAIGPLASSPAGVTHRLDWDVSLLPLDDRDVIVRLRTISHPTKAGLIQHVPSYNLEVGRIVPSRPEIRSSDGLVVFPVVTVGDTTSVDLVLQNAGTETLSVHDAALRFSRSFPFDLAPGSADTLAVFLEPLTDIGIPEDLRIASNDPVTPTLSIPITADVRALTVITNAQTETGIAPLGEALTIQVVPGDGVHVERGTLFHRPAGGGAFTQRSLVPSGGAFISVIPGEEVTEAGLEYWVEVENSGVFMFDPPGAPDSLFFQPVASPERIAAAPQAGSGGRFLANRDIPVVVELGDGVVFERGSLSFRRAGETAWTSLPLVESERGPAADIPAAAVGARGVEFWAEVATRTNPRITDPAGDPEHSPRAIQVSVLEAEEPAATPGNRYRMVSIPLDFDPEFAGTLADVLADEEEFGLPDSTRWRAFRWLSSAGTVELASGDSRFRPEPGRAFWLISRSDHRVDSAPIEALSVRSDQSFAIELAPGWNQIGNPFAFPVGWDAVTKSSAEIGEPVSFDPSLGTIGDYKEGTPSVLAPFQGYFLKNNSSGPETL
jgi:hypothetical protein